MFPRHVHMVMGCGLLTNACMTVKVIAPKPAGASIVLGNERLARLVPARASVGTIWSCQFEAAATIYMISTHSHIGSKHLIPSCK